MSDIDIKQAITQQSTKLEEKILKAIFKHNSALLDVIEIITEKCFTINEYASIFKAMIEIYKKDDVITAESVELWLEQNGYVIDYNIIKKLYNEGFTTIKIKKTAEILKELYQRRIMLQKMREVLDNEEENPRSSNEILEDINNIAMTSNDLLANSVKDIKCCSDKNQILKDIELKLKNKIENDSVKSGFRVIDEDLGGLKRGKLWCIVADSQVGKSALAVQLCTQAQLLNDDLDVMYYSLEMDKDECTQRALADITNIEPRHLDDPIKFFTRFDETTSTYVNYFKENPNGELVREFKKTIREGVDILSSFNFNIDDDPDLDITAIEARIKKYILRHGKLDIIVVDHVGIVCEGTPSEVVGKMDVAYNKLKQIAKKFNCVVIALHQFGKELSNDAMRFPNIFSLRGSSAPRHYADIICGIYRPEVYPELIKDNPQLKGVCQLIWQKVRYTKKPDITEMEYNGFLFKEKTINDFGTDIVLGEITLEDE